MKTHRPLLGIADSWPWPISQGHRKYFMLSSTFHLVFLCIVAYMIYKGWECVNGGATSTIVAIKVYSWRPHVSCKHARVFGRDKLLMAGRHVLGRKGVLLWRGHISAVFNCTFIYIVDVTVLGYQTWYTQYYFWESTNQRCINVISQHCYNQTQRLYNVYTTLFCFLGRYVWVWGCKGVWKLGKKRYVYRFMCFAWYCVVIWGEIVYCTWTWKWQSSFQCHLLWL